MDYFQDAVQLENLVLVELQDLALQEHQELLHVQQQLLALLHVMPSTQQDQHRALPQVRLRVQD